jgi:hypothetical protein
MSLNQSHGKTFEDHLKSAFPGTSDSDRSYLSQWDIEKEYDKIDNLPTSIKTSKNNVIELADARKIWKISEPYRLIVSQYKQNGIIKEFYILYEFKITKNEHIKMLGDITYTEVENFHNNLLIFTKGQHESARKFAKITKAALYSRSIIQLNPKIDSKCQRRLQSSINLEKLVEHIKDKHILNKNDFYRGISIHFAIQSSSREFR